MRSQREMDRAGMSARVARDTPLIFRAARNERSAAEKVREEGFVMERENTVFQRILVAFEGRNES